MKNNTLLRTWNDELTILESAIEMFYGCTSLTTFHGGNLSSLTDGSWMFYQCGQLSDVGDFDFSSLEDGEGMFCQCSNLTIKPDLNLPSLTNGESMFRQSNLLGCYFHLPSLTNARHMFYNTGLHYVCPNSEIDQNTHLNFANVEDAHYMFADCQNLTFAKIHCWNVENGIGMFLNDKKLNTVDSRFDNLTSGSNMFYNCVALTGVYDSSSGLTYDSGQINLGIFPKLEIAYEMFMSATSIDRVSGFSCDTITNADKMFYGCTSLEYVNMYNCHNMETSEQMFYCCSALVSSAMNGLESLTNGEQMFYGCRGLLYLSMDNLGENNKFGGYKMFADCPSLTSCDVDLKNLEDGRYMFHDSGTKEGFYLFYQYDYTSALNSYYLKNAQYMFEGSGIRDLTWCIYNYDGDEIDCTCMFDRCNHLRKIAIKGGYHSLSSRSMFFNSNITDGNFEKVQFNSPTSLLAKTYYENSSSNTNDIFIKFNQCYINGDGGLYLTFSSDGNLDLNFEKSQFQISDGDSWMLEGTFASMYNRGTWHREKEKYARLKISSDKSMSEFFPIHQYGVSTLSLCFHNRWFEDSDTLMFVNAVSYYNNVSSSNYASGMGYHGRAYYDPCFLGYIGVASNGSLVRDFLSDGQWSVITDGNGQGEGGIYEDDSVTAGNIELNTYLIEKNNKSGIIVGAYLQTEEDLSDLIGSGGGDIDNTPYDVSEINGYIPYANEWNEKVYTPNKSLLKIVCVSGGEAFDEIN